MPNDDDLIRRGDARDILSEEGWLGRSLERIKALPAVTVGVKPLVWVDSVANTPIGPYQIRRSGEKYRAVYFDRDYLRDEHGRLRDFFDEEDAQTAAQADYEARGRAMWEPQPAPDAAAIREAALREAHDAIADYPRVAPDATEAQHYDEQIEYCQSIILALITEKPNDRA